MALKAVLESIDDLDETLKAEYTEREGKFYLDIVDVDNHPKVVALKNAHERQKKDNGELKTKVTDLETKFKDVPDDFSIDEWSRLQALDGIDPNDPNAKEKRKQKADEQLTQLRTTYEQQISALKSKYDKDIADKDAVIDNERSLRARDKSEVELSKALDKANIDPKFRNAVRALHAGSVKHAVEEDGTVRVFFESDLGEVEPATYIESWAQTDEGKPFVSIATGPAGKQAGDGRSITNNPFSPEHWNKTQQAALRTDLAKGERYARAAGFADFTKGLAATKPIAPAK